MNAGPSPAQQQLAAGAAGGGKLKNLVKAHGQMMGLQSAAGQRRVNMDAVKGDGTAEPAVNTSLLSFFDPDTNSCKGYLHKKGGSKGGGVLNFQRRNWNNRKFVLSIDIKDNENYTLK